MPRSPYKGSETTSPWAELQTAVDLCWKAPLSLKLLRIGYLLGLVLGSALFVWNPLIRTLTLAAQNDEYTHILLILPLTLALIYIQRKSLGSLFELDVLNGSFILCVAAVAAGLARSQATRMTADLQLSIKMLALVTWWIGSFVLCFGSRISRSLIFPLCFLYLMVPLPSFVLNYIIKYLQHWSAVVTRVLFTTAGVPVSQDGLQLSIPGLTVEIAKECSSIRSSLILLVTTMVLSQLLMHSTWRKALVVMLALPLSVAKNGLRIFTIAMLGTRVDPGFLNGNLHRNGGIVFFAIALGVIFILLWILNRTHDGMTRAAVVRPPDPETLTMVNSR